jgi:hypothetical protein
MPFVSVTRLELRSLRYLPALIWDTYAIRRQASRSPGFIAGTLPAEPLRTFWTLTVWEDKASMLRFRNSDQHLRSMPRLLRWCDEASYAHWEQAERSLPSLAEAHARLLASGVRSKTLKPDRGTGRLASDALPRPGPSIRPR